MRMLAAMREQCAGSNINTCAPPRPHLLRDLQEPQQQLGRRAGAVREVELVVAQPAVQEALAVVHLAWARACVYVSVCVCVCARACV